MAVPRTATWLRDRDVKVWFDESTREHYEAQLIRIDGQVRLEIGFHAEHAKPADNAAALARLLAAADGWRAELGDEAEAGSFLGRDGWVRISEVWDAPEPGPIDVVIEIAARLAEYINALEPVRRSGR